MKPEDPWVIKYKIITDGLFRKFFAIFLSTGGGIFLYKAAFRKMEEGEEPSQVMLMAVGFVMATVLTTIIQYFFGTSQSSQDKEKIK